MKKESQRIYEEKCGKSEEKKEAKTKYDQKGRKRKRIEESLLHDAQVASESHLVEWADTCINHLEIACMRPGFGSGN